MKWEKSWEKYQRCTKYENRGKKIDNENCGGADMAILESYTGRIVSCVWKKNVDHLPMVLAIASLVSLQIFVISWVVYAEDPEATCAHWGVRWRHRVIKIEAHINLLECIHQQDQQHVTRIYVMNQLGNLIADLHYDLLVSCHISEHLRWRLHCETTTSIEKRTQFNFYILYKWVISSQHLHNCSSK